MSATSSSSSASANRSSIKNPVGFAWGAAKAGWRGTTRATQAVVKKAAAAGGQVTGSSRAHALTQPPTNFESELDAGVHGIDEGDDEDEWANVVDLTDFAADDEIPLHSPGMENLLLPQDSSYCSHFDNNVRRCLYYLHLENLPKRQNWDQLRQTIAMSLTVLYSQEEKEQLLRVVVQHMDTQMIYYVISYLQGRLSRHILHELMHSSETCQNAFINYLEQHEDEAIATQLEEFLMYCSLWREYFMYKYKRALKGMTTAIKLSALQQMYQEFLVMGLDMPELDYVFNGHIEVLTQQQRLIEKVSASFSSNASMVSPSNGSGSLGSSTGSVKALPKSKNINTDKSAMQLLEYSIDTMPEQLKNPPPSPSPGTPHYIRTVLQLKPKRFVTAVLCYYAKEENWEQVRQIAKDYSPVGQSKWGVGKTPLGCAGLPCEQLLTVDCLLDAILYNKGPHSIAVEVLDTIKDRDAKLLVAFRNGLFGAAIEMAADMGDKARLKKMKKFLERVGLDQEVQTYIAIIDNLLDNKQLEWKEGGGGNAGVALRKMMGGLKKGVNSSVGFVVNTAVLASGGSTSELKRQDTPTSL